MTNTIPTETSRWTGHGPTDYDTPTKRAEGAILLKPTFENKDAQNFWNYVNDFWAIFRYKGQYILTDEAWDLTAEDSPNGIITIKFFSATLAGIEKFLADSWADLPFDQRLAAFKPIRLNVTIRTN